MNFLLRVRLPAQCLSISTRIPSTRNLLRAIQEVAGGHYKHVAIADAVGEIELFPAEHPYWASIRPVGDIYWTRTNAPAAKPVTVPVTTLDALASELDLKPPFLIKMDVQGAETKVLRGARHVLAETLAVISEADIADFQTINAEALAAGFDLYDVTDIARIKDGDLGWFYTCHISKRLEHLKPLEFWDKKDSPATIALQEKRRAFILENNKKLINRIKYHESHVERNSPCPCNSGRRFKHCCGAFA